MQLRIFQEAVPFREGVPLPPSLIELNGLVIAITRWFIHLECLRLCGTLNSFIIIVIVSQAQ